VPGDELAELIDLSGDGAEGGLERARVEGEGVDEIDQRLLALRRRGALACRSC